MKRKGDGDFHLIKRLIQRETIAPPPAAETCRTRKFYENIVPNTTIGNIQPPPGFCVSRFTPCGRYLISFDTNTNEVVLYRYKGIDTSSIPEKIHEYSNKINFTPSRQPQQQPPPQQSQPHRSIKFLDVFSQHIKCSVTSTPDEQLFAFSLIVHTKYVILASFTPEAHPREEEANWMRISESVTFHLLDMDTGIVVDRLSLDADCLNLSHHCSASLFEDTFVILAPQRQTVFVVTVEREGRFTLRYTLGSQCREDDIDVIAQQTMQELNSNGLQSRGDNNTTNTSNDIHTNTSNNNTSDNNVHSSSIAILHASTTTTTTANALDPGTIENDTNDPRVDPVSIASDIELMIEQGHVYQGLKQRLLARLYTIALEETRSEKEREKEERQSSISDGDAKKRKNINIDNAAAASGLSSNPSVPIPHHRSVYGLQGGTNALQSFYFSFKTYISLKIRRIQLLDASRLLICWLPGTTRSVGPSINSKAIMHGLFSIYNMETTCIEDIFENGNAFFATWVVHNPALIFSGSPCNDWEQFLIPGHRTSILPTDSFSQRFDPYWPVACQVRQNSPYLDAELFQYDGHAVTRDILPVSASRRAVKFIATSCPDKLSFKLDINEMLNEIQERLHREMGAPGDAGGDGAHQRQHLLDVLFLFHPVEPFVMAMIENEQSEMTEELVFFTHAS